VLFALWVLDDEAKPVQKRDDHEATSGTRVRAH
jgi:hypothetical protein